MFIRRSCCWLTFIFTFFVFSSSWANNTPVQTQPFYRNVYLDINLGYAVINWERFNPAQSFVINRNARGGFSFGADTGYQCNQNLAVELGWYYLPEVKYTIPTDVHFTQRSWLGYFGLKVLVPIANQLYLFGKFAASYRYLDFISSPGGVLPNGQHALWRPAAAVGWQYNMTSTWSFSMQYMYVYGRVSNGVGAVIAPDINLITLALGYRFQV